ncbi:hypothetical protein HMPREF0574_0686 [Mobiluncus curtisii subsp. curtisii ATCC 35241]|nr:hypothetical protein HMPREF0574_0686 [Mobiluncus curtisii subsp. curtisii ATCC 35241]
MSFTMVKKSTVALGDGLAGCVVGLAVEASFAGCVPDPPQADTPNARAVAATIPDALLRMNVFMISLLESE